MRGNTGVGKVLNYRTEEEKKQTTIKKKRRNKCYYLQSLVCYMTSLVLVNGEFVSNEQSKYFVNDDKPLFVSKILAFSLLKLNRHKLY